MCEQVREGTKSFRGLRPFGACADVECGDSVYDDLFPERNRHSPVSFVVSYYLHGYLTTGCLLDLH